MRFPFSLIFLLLMMFVGTSFAQNDFYNSHNSEQENNNMDSPSVQKKTIYRSDNQWYMDSSKVEADIIVNALKSNPESASEYSTAMALYYPGLVFASAGGFAVGYGLVSWLMGGSETGMYLTLGGAVSCGIGLLLGYFSDNHLDSSIEIYNMSIGNETAFKVKFLPTEQGGLALAFAF